MRLAGRLCRCTVQGWQATTACPLRTLAPNKTMYPLAVILAILYRMQVQADSGRESRQMPDNNPPFTPDPTLAVLIRLHAAATAELRNTSCLMSSPPQSSAAWELRNAITKEMADWTEGAKS